MMVAALLAKNVFYNVAVQFMKKGFLCLKLPPPDGYAFYLSHSTSCGSLLRSNEDLLLQDTQYVDVQTVKKCGKYKSICPKY